MRNLGQYLDDLVDKNGLKTEVIVTLPDRTLWRTGALVVGSVLTASVCFFLVRAIANSGSSLENTP